jgi:5-carboxymethyl-2-hydroxymuconate isomerase
MPHLNIEYSANLDDVLDIQALVDRIHDTALDTERIIALPMAIPTQATST